MELYIKKLPFQEIIVMIKQLYSDNDSIYLEKVNNTLIG